MDVIITGTVMCQHRVTNREDETKMVQLIIDAEDSGPEVVVSLDAARFYPVGTKVILTLEVAEDATH